MKIIDKVKAQTTLDDVSLGDVVRLNNGRGYLIGSAADTYERYLINLTTGQTHVLKNGHRTACTVVDATLTVGG